MFFEWALVALADPRSGPWKVQLLGGVFDLLFGIALLFAYGFAVQNLEYKTTLFGDFLKERLVPFISEGLKAIAHIILGMLLFIIPGVVFYVLYTFFVYVVFFNPQYGQGDFTALQESRRLVKPRFFRILGLVVLFGVISVVLELSSKVLGLTYWWQEIFFTLAGFYFSGFTFMFFYGLYKKYEEKV